jgi:hypothetical protein
VSAPVRLPAARGAAWILAGAGLARRAGLPFAVSCVWLGALSLLPIVGPLVAALGPVFYAGLVTQLDAGARGLPVRTQLLWAGFVAPGAFVRLLPPVALQVALLVALAALVRHVAGPELDALADAAKANASPDQALMVALLRKVTPALGAMLPVIVGVQWLQMLAVPRAMAGVPGAVALVEAVAGVWRNLGAFAVNLLCQAAIAFALGVGFALLAVLASVVGALGEALLLVGCLAAAFALNAAVMARAAHEVFATDAPADVPQAPGAPPVGPDHIEA